jgi:hypothetical protein
MAINRAMTERRILYILALDRRDAFGSVSHMQLKNNLSSLGLHKRLSKVIMDSYNEAKVKIENLNGMTNDINIARGVKQGCPLSPVLFDSCIDPLIEKLSSAQFKDDGFYWGFQKEDGVTAQAYADDILLFSSSYQGLTNLFNVVQDFIYESNIHLNTKKCEILRIGDDGQTSFEIKDLRTFETSKLNCEDGSKIIRYLGAPLGKGKVTKMKWCEGQLIKMKSKATLIAESWLKTCQVIDAFKTFVIPMAEFLLRHSNISLIKLELWMCT